MLDLADAVRPGVLRSVVQPVVRLADDTVVGYEALVRLPDGETPEDAARSGRPAAGVRPAVELACLRAAAARSARRRRDGCCSSTSAPACSSTPSCRRWCARCRAGWCWRSPSTRQLPPAPSWSTLLAPLLDGGARLAVDDTGSGYASLEHVVELRPEFLKLSSAAGDRPGPRPRPPRAGAGARRLRPRGRVERRRRGGRARGRAARAARRRRRARAGVVARPARGRRGRSWPPDPRTAGPASPCRPEPGAGELAAALERCPDARTACQALVASPRPAARLDAERLPARRGPAPAAGPARLLARLRRHAGRRPGVMGRTFTHRRAPSSSATSPPSPTTSTPSPGSPRS